ncbi:MAG: ubiE/COQ5 methyltransferase family protein [Gammaproteobacteria bacterium]|nr:ubiE/COQ5 methyltransferase family protein [Gammaproteobacteria bacterium]
MVTEESGPLADEWSEWLLHRRHGGDPEYESLVKRAVEGFADRVLDDARLGPGMMLVDIGAGDGLLAFRAIGRMGANIHVILTDISAALLGHAKRAADQRGVLSQCTFLECSAERLAGIPDSTVDVVATRASIAYVADKRAAFAEIHRILKPGGRLSIGEPIFQDEAFAARALRERREAGSDRPEDRFLTLLHRWKAAQFPDTAEGCLESPIVNYSERDLLNLVRGTGFSEIHLELHIDVAPSLVTSWECFLGTAPHPLAPSLRTILAEKFSPEERQLFEELVRPTVESRKNSEINRMVYLNARKPMLNFTP